MTRLQATTCLKQLGTPEQCLVHRLLYYVHTAPILTDREYDMLERDAINQLEAQGVENHLMLLPGSDRAQDYPSWPQVIAHSLVNPDADAPPRYFKAVHGENSRAWKLHGNKVFMKFSALDKGEWNCPMYSPSQLLKDLDAGNLREVPTPETP